ncbi:MAG TPA: aminotransferase class V-fold PLP-dependent enzyme [Thermoguttaceae bacterium]
MDNHATTRVDARVLEAMLPYFTENFGNAGSITHSFGLQARDAVEESRENIAAAIGAKAKEIVFTSGSTESNNLALRGVADKLSSKGRHLISVVTEHPSVLDPLEKLGRRGFDVTLLPVIAAPHNRSGLIQVEQLAQAMRKDTILVSVMLANNEIGAIQPMAEIVRLCKQREVILHTDATQAVGKIPVKVDQLQVDLMSFTAHKIYGPKGIGALYVRRGNPQLRLEPLIDGGGQEAGLRSGTLNVPGIVGFTRALELCLQEMPEEQSRLRSLRDRLYLDLTSALSGVLLNGPALELVDLRLPGNLNVSFDYIDGESLLMNVKDLALSSGSACTSTNPEPSHVLRALGLKEETVRGSIRFGLGRFNTAEEVDFAVTRLSETVNTLRKMSSMA